MMLWRVPAGTKIANPGLMRGTKRRRYLEENIGALDVHLATDELAEIDAILPAGAADGSRYSAPGMRTISR
jgi:hypothetical protein